MRFNPIFLALNFIVVGAHAQQSAPKASIGMPTAPVTTKEAPSPLPVPGVPTTNTLAVPATPLAEPKPGVLTLSEIAKQPPSSGPSSTETPKVGAIQPIAEDAQAITILDGKGLPATSAQGKFGDGDTRFVRAFTITLSRISTQGADSTALLWVQGQSRRVVPGARVLQYTVGDIREDGVCLYVAKGKVKDHCAKLLTFTQGV